jgi:hypothetical protein
MKWESLCYGLALFGLILTGVGRTLLASEAASIGTGWTWAVRLLPLADLMFLARFWDSAKTGALMSLAGLILLMPLGAKTLYEQEHPRSVDARAAFGKLNGDQKSALFNQIKMEHDVQLRTKQRKLTQLNEHMGVWYSSMQNRRASLATVTPAEVAQFNEEAAAYSALLEITKQEAAELQKLLNRNLSGWSSITDDEYADFLRQQPEGSRRIRIPFGSSTRQP